MKKILNQVLMKKNMEMFSDAKDVYEMECNDADELFTRKEIDIILWREKVHQAEIAYMFKLESIMVSVNGIMTEELKIGGDENVTQ